MLRKLREFRSSDNDAYFLDVVGNRVVVNEGEQALRILSDDLVPVAVLPLPGKISIYGSYAHPREGLLVLFCPDQECLVRVSLDSMEVAIVSWPDQSIPSPVHFWDGSDLLVATYDGRFYRVAGQTVSGVLEEQVADKYPAFYGLWRFSNTVQVKEFRSPLSLVYLEESQLLCRRVPEGVRQFARPDFDYHMYDVQGSRALLVAERRLDVVTGAGVVATLVQAGAKVYLKARFCGCGNTARFVVLGGDNSDVSSGVIELFEVGEQER